VSHQISSGTGLLADHAGARLVHDFYRPSLHARKNQPSVGIRDLIGDMEAEPVSPELYTRLDCVDDKHWSQLLERERF
jgi:hypothetical protein